jgi:hypothetical protein
VAVPLPDYRPGGGGKLKPKIKRLEIQAEAERKWQKWRFFDLQYFCKKLMVIKAGRGGKRARNGEGGEEIIGPIIKQRFSLSRRSVLPGPYCMGSPLTP